jgi:hypothetical protein
VGSEGNALSLAELIQFGARWEDDSSDFQAFRHFYDPVNDRPLDLGGTAAALMVKSPDWALEDASTFVNQAFSYRHARDYLYKALTESSGIDRRRYFGLTFQSIGHVIHHLQDMAQPQHVRNDPHCDSWKCMTAATLTGYPRLYAPSGYEAYTDLDSPNDPSTRIRPNLPYLGDGSTPVYPGANAADTPFRKPRDFWRTTAPGASITPGKGIAEYTNRNFFSAGTIAAPYPTPHWPTLSDWYAPSEVVDIQALLPGTSLSGVVHFFGRTVTDARDGTTLENRRALTDSLLDGDLAQLYASTAETGAFVFALNRFTHDAAHRYLIPRAVAYSAGLINYFFRGQLEITPPDEGIYAIVDHALVNLPDVDGFRRIDLKVRNATSAGVDPSGQPLVEPIPDNSPGTLVAVVKFHRNHCYRADLSGEYGSPGIDWRGCRSAFEEIVASQPQPVPNGINQRAVAVSFDFASPVPINATDVFLQVVYRGPLGEEADAVAVATKDVSEPTYRYVFSTWDQYRYCAGGIISSDPPCARQYTFKQSFCDQAHPELTFEQCKAFFGATYKFRPNPTAQPIAGYDPANPAVPQGEYFAIALEPPFAPVAAMATPVGSFTRVALLLDLSPADPVLIVDETEDRFRWTQVPQLPPTVNQLDLATGEMTIGRRYAQARGVYVETTPYDWNPALSDHYLLSSGDAPDISALSLMASQIDF